MFFWFETYREEWERGTVMNAKGLSIFLYFFLYYHFLSSAKVFNPQPQQPTIFSLPPILPGFCPYNSGDLNDMIWVLWAVRDRLWSLSGWSEVTALELSWATESSHLITQMWQRTTGRDQPQNMPTIAPKLWLGRNMDCKHWTSHWANMRLRGPGGDLQFSVLDLMY